MGNRAFNIDSYNLLTYKQHEAVKLLSKYKTSKEISRELGISPHTVDQRIDAAKRRLGAVSRGDLVRAYLELEHLCQQLTYEESHIDFACVSDEPSVPEPLVVPNSFIDPHWFKSTSLDDDISDYQVGPEFFEGRFGTLFRVFAIFGMVVAILMMITATISIYISLSNFVST